MKTFRRGMKPGTDVASAPSVREVCFGDDYSRCASTGPNADLKTHSMMPSISREGATVLESFLVEHGGWKALLWTPPYSCRQIKITRAKRSSQVNILHVEFSAELEQVVN